MKKNALEKLAAEATAYFKKRQPIPGYSETCAIAFIDKIVKAWYDGRLTYMEAVKEIALCYCDWDKI